MQVQSFFSRLSSLNRKASRTLQRDNVNGDNEDSDDEDDDLLLEEELEYLDERLRNKEIDDICHLSSWCDPPHHV